MAPSAGGRIAVRYKWKEWAMSGNRGRGRNGLQTLATPKGKLALWLLVLSAALGHAVEEYEIGGPLAGLKLPLFPTQYGEMPGYPGVLTGLKRYGVVE